MDGVLVIDKPGGPTSHDVVARVRTALRQRRVGHTGTLDPMATGVLPLVLGRATRLAQFLSASAKSYEARVRLGLVTDTYDVTGRVTEEYPVPPAVLTHEVIERSLAALRGAYLQTPPAYSAKKVGGVRAYDMARRTDQPLVLDPVPVTVDSLELIGIEADTVRLRMTVSAGFYVRVLAHDLGAALGVGGCLASLRRTRSGEFDESRAVPLAAVEEDPDVAWRHLVPLEDLLPAIPGVRLTGEGSRRARNGAALAPGDVMLDAAGPSGAPGGLVRLLDADGRLVGLARAIGPGTALHPIVVLG
jgi:tRNA pseudouridine55 synthase